MAFRTLHSNLNTFIGVPPGQQVDPVVIPLVRIDQGDFLAVLQVITFLFQQGLPKGTNLSARVA
jgi:hypothetical protein